MPHASTPPRNTRELVLTGARLATPEGILDEAWIAVSGERITALGTGSEPAGGGTRWAMGGALIAPGFIDLHCHGGGGATFSSTDPTDIATASTTHRHHGTTTLLASLVSDEISTLTSQLTALAELVSDGQLAGIHLEGPFLAPAYRGAHDATVLSEPDGDVLDTLLRAGRGHLRMVTLAPELPGGIAAVRQLSTAGVTTGLGHTAGTHRQIQTAIEAGARVATHLFNGMPPLHHRAPGPVGALLADERVTVELIADGIHLHPTVLRMAARSAGPGRTVLITDATPAAGAADGRYRLGRLDIDVVGGVATSTDDNALAGSTLTMDTAFRNMITVGGMSIPEAVEASASRPAELLGLAHRTGKLQAGLDADLVVLDDDMRLRGVLQRGRWIRRPDPTYSRTPPA